MIVNRSSESFPNFSMGLAWTRGNGRFKPELYKINTLPTPLHISVKIVGYGCTKIPQ